MRSDVGFVTALKNVVKANVLGMIEILKIRRDAIFIQSESSEYFHADSPAAIGHAESLNSRRFLSLDLNYGRRVDSDMYEYLLDNGMTREEYHFFLEHNLKQFCILGTDYYRTNEHRVHPNGQTEPRAKCLVTARLRGNIIIAIACRDAHRNQLPRRPDRAGSRAMVVEGVGQRPAPA
jgi:hypothetical protein